MNRYPSTLRFLAALALSAIALPVSAGSQRAETVLNYEGDLRPGQSLQVDNLVGSLIVRGDDTGGRVLIEARVIAEAATEEEAEALRDAIALRPTDGDGRRSITVEYPVRRHSGFRLPRSEREGVMDKWVTPLVRKSVVSTEYDGQTVEVGGSKGSVAIAVHVKVTVPMDVRASFRQVVGSLHGIGLRGDLAFEAVDGEILTEQIYGALEVRTGGGQVTVRKFGGETFRLQTASGNVTLIDVTADEAELLSGAGKIEADGITAAKLAVDSGAGAVLLDRVDSETIRVDSESGVIDVAARLTRTREASIISRVGDVTLRVNPTTPFELKAEAESGSVRHRDLAAEVIDEEKNSVHLTRGKGGAAVEIRTGKGAVTIRAI
ncbi:MAG TPA: DUF4097 family beta strand repeat-containing protein [Candidatus Polarisedimenticolaceae bacterium]|nr:DUF4097 family beta strand repeat-containing protein [Candidatus Polarisedimenticolaceae bacterium]